MLIGMRNAMLAGGGLSAKDYVQDGLYYMLDGIENAGYGVHNSSASTWADLSGNNRNATFLNASAGVSWLDNAVYLRGVTKNGMAKVRGLPSMTSFMVEVVFKADEVEDWGRLFDVEAYTSNSEYRRFCVVLNTGTDMLNSNFQICWSGVPVFSQIPKCYGMQKPMALTIFPTVSNGYVTASNVWANGGAIKETQVYSTSKYAGTPPAYMDMADRSNGTNRGANMAVYSVRVYNRFLSAAEISANYAVDKARFNLA